MNCLVLRLAPCPDICVLTLSSSTKLIEAERTLVSAQVRGWRNEALWAAWKDIRTGDQASYGQLIAAENLYP